MQALRNLPPTNSPLHLYRALLRECTYLPDAAAREYGSQYIRHRFKRLVDLNETQSAIRNARRGLSLLIRANEGDLDALKRVLMLAYGRTRQRRAELLVAYREKMHDMDAGFDLSFDEALQPGEDIKLPPSLKLLYESQKQSGPRSSRFKLENIPALNAKGLPMPAVRLPRLRYKAVLPMISKLLPPLPDKEWDRLVDMVTHKSQVVSMIPRRSSAASGLAASSHLTVRKLEAAPGKQKFVVGGPHRRARPISRRAMRRLYAHILASSPRLRKDAETGKWSVEYFSKEMKSRPPTTTHPVFSGVTKHGKLLEEIGSCPDTSIQTEK